MEIDKETKEKLDKYLDTMTWYHSEKLWPQGFFSTVGRIEDNMKKLNQNIESAISSSTKLTNALNKITLAGVIVAGVGILVAICNLSFEIYKFIATK